LFPRDEDVAAAARPLEPRHQPDHWRIQVYRLDAIRLRFRRNMHDQIGKRGHGVAAGIADGLVEPFGKRRHRCPPLLWYPCYPVYPWSPYHPWSPWSPFPRGGRGEGPPSGGPRPRSQGQGQPTCPPKTGRMVVTIMPVESTASPPAVPQAMAFCSGVLT